MRRNLTGLLALVTALAVLLVTVTVWQGPQQSEAAYTNTIVTLDTGNVGAYLDMVLDPSGDPVISYYDSDNDDLKVARCGNPTCSSGNTIATPDTTGDVGKWTSIQLDVSGNPVVSYYDDSGDDLKILHCGNATCTSGNSIVSADTTGDVGQYTSLQLDASDFPVVSYYDATSNEISILHCNDPDCAGGGDTISQPGVIGGGNSSLVLDSSGNPVIAMVGSGLTVMHCDDANCDGIGESVETPETFSTHMSLQLDGSGNPVISYRHSGSEDLRVMHCNDVNCAGSNESIETVDAGITPLDISLELDSSGNPAISYANLTNSELRVVDCNDPDCAGGGDSIVSPDTTGQHTSLELGTGDNPIVAYRAEGDGLKVLTCSKPNCVAGLPTHVVDSTSDTVDIDPGNGICEDAFGDCTLRAAIQETNALAGKQIIEMPPGTYAITIGGTGEDAAATGDLDITDDLTIYGSDAGVIIEGNGADRVFHVVSGVVFFHSITIQGGGSVAGAGILNDAFLILGNIYSVTVRDNHAAGNGGGVHNTGTMNILNSTIGGQTAPNVDAGSETGNSSDMDGGGISNAATGIMSIISSTISGNDADNHGGGIFNAGTLTMNNVTISNNSADADATAGGEGGGIYTDAAVDLANTLIARNLDDGTGPDCRTVVSGDLASDGYNLLGDDTGCTFTTTAGDLSNVDSNIHTLQDNGGDVALTHALPSSSPAIDAGNPAAPATFGYPACALVEQRIFVTRPIDGDLDGVARCDIGAYEASSVAGPGCAISNDPPPLQGCKEYTFSTTNLAVDIGGIPLPTPCTATGQVSIEHTAVTPGPLDGYHIDIKALSGYIDCPGGFYDGSSIPNEGTIVEQANTTGGLDFPLDGSFTICIIADTYPYGFLRNCPDSGASKDPLLLDCKIADLDSFDCSVSSPSTFYNASPVPTPVAEIGSGTIDLDIIPTPTKQAAPADTDKDGCSDAKENGGSAAAGGLRNFKNFWDFYDVDTENGAGAGTRLQGAISLGDILKVANRFGQTGDPSIDPLSDTTILPDEYHTRFDRGTQLGPHVWNRGPANGAISLGDVLAIATQFGHSCL